MTPIDEDYEARKWVKDKDYVGAFESDMQKFEDDRGFTKKQPGGFTKSTEKTKPWEKFPDLFMSGSGSSWAEPDPYEGWNEMSIGEKWDAFE